MPALKQKHRSCPLMAGLAVLALIPGCRGPAHPPAPSRSPVTTAAPRQPLSVNDQLLAAAGAGDNARIAALLHQGASLNYVGATGPPLNYRGTALLAAVSNRQLSTVKFLLARRATVTPDLLLVTSKLLTWTSTRQAEYEEVASVLIDHGADVNAIAEWESAGSQYTPLVMAARGGSLRLVKELLAHGAGIEREGIRSPIEEAEEQGYPEVVRLLRRAARRRHR